MNGLLDDINIKGCWMKTLTIGWTAMNFAKYIQGPQNINSNEFGNRQMFHVAPQ